MDDSQRSFLMLGSVRFDRGARRLIDAQGQDLPLRPQSLAVLGVLANNKGETVSKNDLIASAWGATHVTDDSLIQCIADIRRAIGDEGHSIIQTVPRVGYKLVPTQPEPETASRVNSRWLLPAAALAVLVVIALVATWMALLRPSWMPSRPSIAVLPFEHISDDQSQAFFTDGVSKSITTNLSRFEGLFVVSSYYPDGAGSGRSVRNLARGCVAAGHEAVVVRLSSEKHGFIETVDGVKIYHRPLKNIYVLGGDQKPAWQRFIWHTLDVFNPFMAWDFYKILKAEKPDVVNTNIIAGFSPSIFFVTRLARTKLIHTMRDYYLLCAQNAMFKKGKSCEGICGACKPFVLTRKIAARHVDVFLANSDHVARVHTRHGALPENGVCCVQMNANDDDTIGTVRTLPSDRPVVFGFIGRLAPSKGVEILLRAVERLETQSWVLKIAGQGQEPYVEALRKQNPDSRIEYLGHCDADAFYSDIDVLICPSLYGEPLPRVVYEAYRAGVPVVASRAGGTPEIVEVEKTGFLYDAFDDKALAKCIDDIAEDGVLYKNLSAGALKKATLFKRSSVTQQFLEHVEQVVA